MATREGCYDKCAWLNGIVVDMIDFAYQNDLPEVMATLIRTQEDLSPFTGATPIRLISDREQSQGLDCNSASLRVITVSQSGEKPIRPKKPREV